jgi:hypothetical protein
MHCNVPAMHENIAGNRFAVVTQLSQAIQSKILYDF